MAAGSNKDLDNLRIGSALIVAVVGLLVPAILAWALSAQSGWKPSEVTSLIGAFTTIVGTLVGAFLGVQVGAVGKQKAENLANAALNALSPERAAQVRADQ